MDLEKIWETKPEKAILGRTLLVKFILDQEQNQSRLNIEKIKKIDDFYDKYLLYNCPAFVPRKKPGARRVVRIIHSAGGVAIWAHPVWTINEHHQNNTRKHLSDSFQRMLRAGIDGVEVLYPGIKENMAITLYNMCWNKNLLITGGSDWHGEDFRKGEKSVPGTYPVFKGMHLDILSKILVKHKG